MTPPQPTDDRPPLTINVCPNCQPGAEEHLTDGQRRQHSVQILTDYALIRTFMLLHGEQAGLLKYLREGGALHMSEDHARRRLGLPRTDPDEYADEDHL